MANYPVTLYEAKLNRLTAVLIISLVVMTICGIVALPDRISIHFNESGKADRWGSPVTTLIVPFFCLLIEGVLRAVRNVPTELMNFPGPRTPENIDRQMQNTMLLFATMRVLGALLFLSLQSQWIWSAMHPNKDIFPWLPFVFTGLLLAGVAVYVVRAYRMVRHS